MDRFFSTPVPRPMLVTVIGVALSLAAIRQLVTLPFGIVAFHMTGQQISRDMAVQGFAPIPSQVLDLARFGFVALSIWAFVLIAAVGMLRLRNWARVAVQIIMSLYILQVVAGLTLMVTSGRLAGLPSYERAVMIAYPVVGILIAGAVIGYVIHPKTEDVFIAAAAARRNAHEAGGQSSRT